MSQTKTFGALDDLLRHELAGRGVLVRVDYNLPLDAAGKSQTTHAYAKA